MAERTAKAVYILKFGVLGLVVASYYLFPPVHDFVINGASYLKDRDFEGLRRFILAYGIWAPLTSILLMSVQSLLPFLPGIFLTITNAWIFGWQFGSFYSWLGALLGAVLDFAVARWYGRPVVRKLVREKYLVITDRFFVRYGVMAVLITRLTPIVPFKVVSYGAGLTTISTGQFILATGIGQIPAIIVYSILGQNITHSICAAITATSLLILFAVFVYFYRDSIEHLLFCKKDS
ncbi:Hypothetical protein LUCI_1393 [Lucifera butyrica]|uniref:TVP38/TMEM64 family membrane protein n=1 Tax=Lucifera butyrica TaxID=1351585 RepID=A0A498R5R5_9FIRM|nr:TVP38/TMEM64 family protein [Lucifera butyrica]VBB06177.1 Hypothetical protein LUCI_1393 [Lucifera butyrica]